MTLADHRDLPYVQAWWVGKLESGVLIGSRGWSAPVTMAQLALDFDRETGYASLRRLTESELTLYVARFLRKAVAAKSMRRFRRMTDGSRQWWFELPGLDFCRQQWELGIGRGRRHAWNK